MYSWEFNRDWQLNERIRCFYYKYFLHNINIMIILYNNDMEISFILEGLFCFIKSIFRRENNCYSHKFIKTCRSSKLISLVCLPYICWKFFNLLSKRFLLMHLQRNNWYIEEYQLMSKTSCIWERQWGNHHEMKLITARSHIYVFDRIGNLAESASTDVIFTRFGFCTVSVRIYLLYCNSIKQLNRLNAFTTIYASLATDSVLSNHRYGFY